MSKSWPDTQLSRFFLGGINGGEVGWVQLSDHIHTAVNVGREVFEEVVSFFLDRPDAEPQPEEDTE